jgi:hypothetical protein
MKISTTTRDIAVLAIREQIKIWRDRLLAVRIESRSVHPALRRRFNPEIATLTEAVDLAREAIADLHAGCSCRSCDQRREIVIKDALSGRR